MSTERANLSYYMLESTSNDVLNRIWNYVESTNSHMLMYKTRISASNTTWVIEMPKDKMESYFLLQFSSYVTSISKPNYYI
jgi:hypothetical protein